MRARLVMPVVVLVTLIAAGLAGCGDDAGDAARRVASDARLVVDEARDRFDDDVAAARREIDEAREAADDEGVPVAEARRAAERAIERAQAAADEAIDEAESRGLDDEARRLRRETEREIGKLRDRLRGEAERGGY